METIEMHGLTFQVEKVHDHDAGTPWDNGEPLGQVTDWCIHKPAGARVLIQRSNIHRLYNFAAAVRTARQREGLKGQAAVEAAEREFERFKAWLNDAWHYVGVIVTLLDAEGNPLEDYRESMWAVEDNGSHADTMAQDLALTIGGLVNWEPVIEVPARTIQLRAAA